MVKQSDGDDLAAYLAGQQSFISNNVIDEKLSADSPQVHLCERCKKPCKKPYKHCYRCNAYLKVKAKISA